MPLIVRLTLVGFGIFLLQWLLLGRLQILGAMPDACLLYIAWLGLRHGRLPASIAGAALGFLMDAAYGTWGIHMFVKTLIGFLVGLFPTERETLRILPQQAFFGGLVVALVHNGLVVALVALQSGARTSFLVSALWLGSALYTAIAGTLATLFAGSRGVG